MRRRVVFSQTWLRYTRGGYCAVALVLEVGPEAVAPHHEVLKVKVLLSDKSVNRRSGPVLVRASGVVAQDNVPDLVVVEYIAEFCG